MRNIPDGILGKLTGNTVGVSGHVRNGQNILRTSNPTTVDKVTPGRMAQREKIKVCTAFTKPFAGTGFFNKTFPAYGDAGSGYNRATSALMNFAVAGIYPNTHLAYPDVLISRGPLPEAKNASASRDTAGDIFFSWHDNSGDGTARADDKVIQVAYFPELKQVIYSLHAADRADCQATLITNSIQGHSAETWIGFLSADENDAANSVYTGRL
ncbi:MAG: DUF6266 family protein [Ginsengibacter sp.]